MAQQESNNNKYYILSLRYYINYIDWGTHAIKGYDFGLAVF